MPNSKTDTEILMNRINERKNGMKKTAAILASIAAMSLCGLSASAADGDNIIDGVLNGAEEIVDGVVSGAEEIITPGGSTSVDESTNDSTTRRARSMKVSVMNSPMRPAPRSTPSVASFSATA